MAKLKKVRKVMKAICEDEEHQEMVPFTDTRMAFDKKDGKPKRICSECKHKDRYKVE